MARPLRIEFEDALYHITSRGNEKSNIYSDDKDRYVFIKILAKVVRQYTWMIYAYCMMNNHYHLLVRTPNANLCRSMRQLNGLYAQYFNNCHERVGHLFQGRFKAILIKDESRLLTVARYVVLNPVRAKIVRCPEDWRWSSYRCTGGLTMPVEFFDPDLILSFFSTSRESAVKQYVAFVRGGIGGESPLLDTRGGILSRGNEVAEVAIARRLGEISEEVPKIERFADRPSLEEIFEDNHQDTGIHMAFCRYGYKLKEIGDFLKLHYSVISRIAKRMDE